MERKICYIILPDGLKDIGSEWIEEASSKYSASIVVLSGMDWNNDLTPWPAEGVFKKAKPFEGHADSYLEKLTGSFRDIEAGLDIKEPERYLIGVSLSGLFVVWAMYNCDSFAGFASISGSLWYDGFVDWARSQTVSSAVTKVFISLGDREKNSKDRRMATVENATRMFFNNLKIPEKKFLLEENTTHFSPLLPRLESALDWLLK